MTVSTEEMDNALWGEGQVSPHQLEQTRQTVRWCSGLSRTELARTICEHWGWVTASGSYKVTACLKVLEAWEARGLLQLPGKRPMSRWDVEPACGAVPTEPTAPGRPLVGELSAVGSVGLEVIQGGDRGRLWKQYVERYHYLGYRQPFGCFVRYFIVSSAGLLGCILMAGAAKALAARDQWIGWDRRCRQQNLPWVINNPRLLIFPWVHIPHLGSHVLGQLGRRVRQDWQTRWGYGPLLMETFVDPAKFCGTCYRAAGWLALARTTGRGLARAGRVYHSTPKLLYVKPLAGDFRPRLCEGPLPRRTEP
jgi:Domain of unknown function (DUF4338)